MGYSAIIKEKLLSLINEIQYHWLFTRNPEKDFSRIKKWSFGEILRFIISMEGKSLEDELLEYFDFSVDTFSKRKSLRSVFCSGGLSTSTTHLFLIIVPRFFIP